VTGAVIFNTFWENALRRTDQETGAVTLQGLSNYYDRNVWHVNMSKMFLMVAAPTHFRECRALLLIRQQIRKIPPLQKRQVAVQEHVVDSHNLQLIFASAAPRDF
jgi:hypothetical protein